MNIFQRIKNIFGTQYEQPLARTLIGRLQGQEYSEREYLETYGKSLYVYACVSRIAEKVASTEFNLYKIINKEGETEKVHTHPVLDLLYKWNPFFTKEEGIETDIINRKLTGHSFIYKVRNAQGEVAELWNVSPDTVSIIQDDEHFIKGYEVVLENGSKEFIAKEDMIYIKYPSPLSALKGMSPLSSVGTRIQTEGYASRYQRDFFLNNARVDGALTTDSHLTESQRKELGTAWDARHKGLGKNSKIAILSGGLKYNQISLSQREMDYIESMKFTRDDVLIAFKVPKPILAISDAGGRSRAETESLMDIFLSETINPETRRLVSKLNEELVIPEFGEEYYLDFTDHVPVNREQQLAEYVAGCDKWITRNEIRQETGRDLIEGADDLYKEMMREPINVGDTQREESKKIVPLHGRRKLQAKFTIRNFIEKGVNEVKKEIKGSSSSLFQDRDQRKAYYAYTQKYIDNHAETFEKAVIKLKNEQKNDFLKELKKLKPKTRSEIRKAFNIKAENDRLVEWAFPRYVKIFEEAGQEAMGLLRLDIRFEMKSLDPKSVFFGILMKRAKLFSFSVNKTTIRKLSDTLMEGIDLGESIPKLSKRVNEVYLDFNEYRATTIARTETGNIINKANLEAYKQADCEGKEWIATLDDRVRDEHLLMDGEIVKVGEAFSNGEMYPGEINCRCAVAPVYKIWT